MKRHIAQLTKQRLSDFFVKEEGHVAHKNALVAGTVATGAILASLMLTPDADACNQSCGDQGGLTCNVKYQRCCGVQVTSHHWQYWCTAKNAAC